MALVNRLSGLQPYVAEWAKYTLSLMQLQTGGKLEYMTEMPFYRVVGGITPTVTSGYRDQEKQKELRELWERSGMHPFPVRYAGTTVYPANRPGDSSHNWGMGWDSDVPDQYMQLWRYVRASVGWTLSAPGVDDVHAEWPGWRDAVRAAGHSV